MFFPMNFFWWFLFWGHSRTILAWLPLWQPWATFFIGKNPRWPPNDVINLATFIFFIKHRVWHMLSGVLGVKESISDDILAIPFHLSHYSEQEAQMDPYCSLKISNFHKNKMTLECNRNEQHFFQFPYFRSFWFFKPSSMKNSNKRPNRA